MALRQCSILIIATQLTCLLVGASSASPEGEVFWVAPTFEQCGKRTAGTAKVHCDTLKGYQQNSSIFSTSHSKWIFLKGEHYMDQFPVIVSGVTNITWTGEADCALIAARCAIIIADSKYIHDRQWHHTTVTFQNSQTIQLAFLEFLTRLGHTVPSNQQMTLTLKNVSNAKISSTIFAVRGDYLETFKTKVEISDPQGMWLIDQTVFSQICATMLIAHCACFSASINSFKCNFSARIINSVFHRSSLITRTGASVSDTYNTVRIIIQQSTISALHVDLEDYPADKFRLSITKSNFTMIYFMLPVLSIPETQHDTASVHIKLWEVKFQCFPKPCNMILFLQILNRTKYDSGCGLLLPNITTSHLTVERGPFVCNVIGTNYKGCNGSIFHVLTVDNSVFEHLMPVSTIPLGIPGKINAIIFIVNMGTFLVTLTGTNKILNNEGCGIVVLYNSRVQNNGYTVIEGNAEGGMLLLSNSLLLLSNNSVLKVHNNRDNGILSAGLSVAGTRRKETPSSLQLWPENNMCFFQLVDIQGRFIHSCELHHFNTSISVSQNRQFGLWRYATNNTWNGHFDGCRLKTQDGSILVRNDTLVRTFGTDALSKLPEEATLPYKICLCSSTFASGNTSLFDCRQVSTISAYPGRAELHVALLADFNRTVSGRISLVVAKKEMFYEIANCTLIPLQWLTQPGETEVTELRLAEYYGGQLIWYLSHIVHVNITECPLGLVHVTTDPGCSCNAVLNEHRFTCSITSPSFTYKGLDLGMWIGYYGEGNDSLAIGHNCPVFYCNNFIFQNGILLEELLDRKQCQQQRTGIMCSKCPKGTSSVFGSFHCRECSHGWVVLVLIFALAGVFILALLFLFNLTLLQGTIQGIVLYANTLVLLGDFFEAYEVKYLYIPIALMNFDLGFETCFFNGMNEFSKAILRFAFPLYLFTLLIITIIVVHKCGYRIFRFRFIARRAVPVLATIMLLTYTDLAGAVITGLRYTTIYNATSGEGHVVWLYQPGLLYFRGPHLVLGILSLAMALLYLIPFTFIMLFGDLLRRYIHKLWFSHFLDVLQGAFRWPFGFWAGLRLLLRMGLIAINITATRPVFALCMGSFFLALRLLQLCINPFRVVHYGDEDCAAQLIRNKPLLQLKLKLLSVKPPTFDGFFLLNVVAVSAVVLFSTCGENEDIVKVLTSILLLLAILECATILIWHTYKFFPVSDKAVDKLKSFKTTLQLVFISLVQRCSRQPNEADEYRGSPVPVLELRLRPPTEEDLLDSSASESESDEDTLQPVDCDETSSRIGCSEAVLSKQQPSKMTGQLQESLLM